MEQSVDLVLKLKSLIETVSFLQVSKSWGETTMKNSLPSTIRMAMATAIVLLSPAAYAQQGDSSSVQLTPKALEALALEQSKIIEEKRIQLGIEGHKFCTISTPPANPSGICRNCWSIMAGELGRTDCGLRFRPAEVYYGYCDESKNIVYCPRGG